MRLASAATAPGMGKPNLVTEWQPVSVEYEQVQRKAAQRHSNYLLIAATADGCFGSVCDLSAELSPGLNTLRVRPYGTCRSSSGAEGLPAPRL